MTSDLEADRVPPAGGWAVVSVVCGVVGCLGVTPLVAVVCGAVGVRRGGPGRRMAAWGLGLGLAWLAGYALAGGLGWVVGRHGATWVALYERKHTVAVINQLPLGRSPPPDQIGPGRSRELAAAVAGLGVCRAVDVTRANFTNRDDVFGIEFHATADFDRGQRPLRARLFYNGTGWGFSELDWR